MKQLARRASLVVVLLLASVGTASAECAWVMWTETHGTGKSDYGPPSGTTEWTFNRTMFETREACEAFVPRAMDSHVAMYNSLGLVVVMRDEDQPKDRPFVFKRCRASSPGSGHATASRGGWS